MFHIRRQVSLGASKPAESIMALLTSFLGKQPGSKRKGSQAAPPSPGNTGPGAVSKTFQERQKRGNRLARSGSFATLLGG